MLSPKTRLFLLAIVLVIIFAVLLYLLDVHIKFGYYTLALFMSMIAIIIYALFAKMKGGHTFLAKK
ncbi:MAG: hypothetical protein QXX51_00785 [Candidatus Bathyarchaeia archaeon]